MTADPAATVDDRTRVDSRTFGDFHLALLAHLSGALNRTLRPPFCSQIRRRPRAPLPPPADAELPAPVGPPDLRRDAEDRAAAADRVAVRDAGAAHRTVALVMMASPGDKTGAAAVGRFAGDAVRAMGDGVHLVLLDLLPPGPADPAGLHGAVLTRLGKTYDPPPGRPLCAASYRCGPEWRAFAEPLAVGDPPPTVPLFLTLAAPRPPAAGRQLRPRPGRHGVLLGRRPEGPTRTAGAGRLEAVSEPTRSVSEGRGAAAGRSVGRRGPRRRRAAPGPPLTRRVGSVRF